MSQQQSWILHNQLSLEVRLKAADSDQMSDPPVSSVKTVEIKVFVLRQTWSCCWKHLKSIRAHLKFTVYLMSCLYDLFSQILVSQVRPSKAVTECCRLLHGARYLAQIRVRYYMEGPWSEWSSSKSGVTLETGRARINSEWHKQPLLTFSNLMPFLSTFSSSFQCMQMSCCASLIASLCGTGWIEVLSFVANADSESIDLSCREKFYFLQS